MAPGRRRDVSCGATWISSLLLLYLLSISAVPAESAVASIDLGSEWLKVAVVNLKQGQSPISIAINEMSKRKSPSLVAFNSGTRLLGEEAAGIAARYPEKVFSLARDMLGKPYQYVKDLVTSLYLPFDLVEDSRGMAGVRIDDGVTVYSPEELLAMVLNYAMGIAEAHAKAQIKDVVITVPPYFGQAQRKGVVQAAQLAGINVLSLINEHAGAALQYGLDKNFSSNSRHVIFYDMGSTNTYAALVYFSAYNTKEFGKTISVNQFQVKDVRWNTQLGGQNMEMLLVEHFAKEFNEKLGNGDDVRMFPKAMAKLKKQVKRTKEILSANTIAPISVESLYKDIDFRSTITREKFENLCEGLWEEALNPVKDVLRYSDLKIDDIYAVELIGGSTRVPKLQAKLQEFLGSKDLAKHLDADEAIALGSSLHAANISDGIKLNRKLGIIDGSSYGFFISFDSSELVNLGNIDLHLVPRMKKLPSKMFRSIEFDKDFEVSFSYDNEFDLPPGSPSAKFAQFSVSALSETSEKYAVRNLSAPIKANLHFSLSRSGILSLDRAEAVIEISEWVDVPKKNLTLENNATSPPNILSEANTTNNLENSDKEALNSESETSISSTHGDEGKQSGPGLTTEKILKKKIFRVPLKIIEKFTGPGTSLSKELFSDAKLRLEALNKIDAERKRTSELKNSLEGYIYATREKLEGSADILQVCTEQDRQSFTEKLSEVQDWLYTDGEDAPAIEFERHLGELKAMGDPIFFRLNELTARPAALELSRVYLADFQKIIINWEKDKPWLPNARVDEVQKESDKLKLWLDEKETLQSKTSDFSKPAFTSEEVYEKVWRLQDKVESVNKIPKPKPKIEKPAKEETGGNENTTSDSGSNSSTGTTSDASDPERSFEDVKIVNNEIPDSEVHDEL